MEIYTFHIGVNKNYVYAFTLKPSDTSKTKNAWGKSLYYVTEYIIRSFVYLCINTSERSMFSMNRTGHRNIRISTAKDIGVLWLYQIKLSATRVFVQVSIHQHVVCTKSCFFTAHAALQTSHGTATKNDGVVDCLWHVYSCLFLLPIIPFAATSQWTNTLNVRLCFTLPYALRNVEHLHLAAKDQASDRGWRVSRTASRMRLTLDTCANIIKL